MADIVIRVVNRAIFRTFLDIVLYREIIQKLSVFYFILGDYSEGVGLINSWATPLFSTSTGKFVPSGYGSGAPGWKEIAKGRIVEVDSMSKIAYGEVYTGGNKAKLTTALAELKIHDYLEIDQYGASAKVLSGLAEYSLAEIAKQQGYEVRRMPEDMAKHLGGYANYDFEFSKGGITRKVEIIPNPL